MTDVSLPEYQEPQWHTKLNNSINAIAAESGSAAADAANAVSTANQARQVAQAAAASQFIGDGDAALAALIETGEETAVALSASIDERAVEVAIPRGTVNFDGTTEPLAEWYPSGSQAALHVASHDGFSGPYLEGVGVDHDGVIGRLVSIKRNGTGDSIDQWPAGGVALQRGNRSSIPIENTDFYVGSGGVQWAFKSGAHFKDGVSTAASPTLTSATAAFVAGDVGKVVSSTWPYPDDIPSGTTILTVNSATSVTLSNNIAATRTDLTFKVADRAIDKTVRTGQKLLRVFDEDSSTTVIYDFRAGSAIFAVPIIARDPGTSALRVYGAPSQTSDLQSWRDSNTNRLSRINKDGRIMSSRNTAPVVGDLDIGEWTFHGDASTGAEKLYVSFRNAAGSLVTKQVTLT